MAPHVRARDARGAVLPSARDRGGYQIHQGPFVPPEDWYEPTWKCTDGYSMIEQTPGPGYRHAVTAREVRLRLEQLPTNLIRPLDVVQLSRMTRKKRRFPCYGMQWGQSVYLYPIEDDLIEYCDRPPHPTQIAEARMYGVRWQQDTGNRWKLVWQEDKLRDFYLNNVLIHELGHLLDQRNTSYTDRERFAEWFAIEYGYKTRSQTTRKRSAKRRIRRRHGKR